MRKQQHQQQHSSLRSSSSSSSSSSKRNNPKGLVVSGVVLCTVAAATVLQIFESTTVVTSSIAFGGSGGGGGGYGLFSSPFGFLPTTTTTKISSTLDYDSLFQDLNISDGSSELILLQQILKRNGNGNGNRSSSITHHHHHNNNNDDDAVILHSVESARCQRYGFTYHQNRTTRRRVYAGGMIADDSWHTLAVHAVEMYDLYAHLVFVESNRTHIYVPRTMRFLPNSPAHTLLTKSNLFGPSTAVTVDYYMVNEMGNFTLPSEADDGILGQQVHRDRVLQNWIRLGMTPDDVGVILDADEFFTRDFLRALQICDGIKEFDDSSCKAPKIIASTLQIESSPNCVLRGNRQWHPDAVIGTCLDGIGNSSIHPEAKRVASNFTAGWRQAPYAEPYTAYPPNQSHYPLWKPVDYRRTPGGKQYLNVDMQTSKRRDGHTAYHLHNFFDSLTHLRFKMSSYGEPVETEGRPLGDFHPQIGECNVCGAGRCVLLLLLLLLLFVQ
jgi:hypothetical protein